MASTLTAQDAPALRKIGLFLALKEWRSGTACGR
jgi:hypothetical protein